MVDLYNEATEDYEHWSKDFNMHFGYFIPFKTNSFDYLLKISIPCQQIIKNSMSGDTEFHDLTHCGPAPSRIALLTKDLLHSTTPYSLWTCLTGEHPNPLVPSPLRNTLLTVDLPHGGTSYSQGPAPPRKTMLTAYLPQLMNIRQSAMSLTFYCKL